MTDHDNRQLCGTCDGEGVTLEYHAGCPTPEPMLCAPCEGKGYMIEPDALSPLDTVFANHMGRLPA